MPGSDTEFHDTQFPLFPEHSFFDTYRQNINLEHQVEGKSKSKQFITMRISLSSRSRNERAAYFVNPTRDVIARHRDVRLAMMVHGPPRAQRRPRFRFEGRMYIPSSPQQNDLRSIIRGAVGRGDYCYFKSSIPVKAKFVFYMPRPKSHFAGDLRRFSSLKTKYEREKEHVGTPDLDNMSKFVLDALVGVGYADDKQVYRLTCSKVWDNEGECLGRIYIELEAAVIDLTE